MQNTINSDLIRGNINTIILKALFEGDRYGYDIIKEIEQKSSGQYVLKQPTLYSCLKRLEVQGFIRSYWGAKSNGGRRKYYTLTEMGHELFARNQSEWEYSRTVIDKLISDREYDFSEIEADFKNENAFRAADDATLNTDEEAPDLFTESLDESDGIPAVQTNLATAPYIEDTTQDEDLADTYIDTADYLDELFKAQKDEVTGDSYTEKLQNESYTAVPHRSPPEFNAATYFADTPAEPEMDAYEPYEEDTYEDERPQINYAKAQPSYTSVPPPPQPIAPAQEQKTNSAFISYKSQLDYAEDEDRALLERDYKNVLSHLVRNQTTAVPEAEGHETAPAEIPLSKEMELNNELVDLSSRAQEQESPKAEDFKTQDAQQKLRDVSTSFKELGDNIYVRTHRSAAATENNDKTYYYQNRLMFVQYTILFFVMLAMIAATFLIARVWLGVRGPIDNFIYLGAILLAAALPITGAILKYREPDKKQRLYFDFKSSLIFRLLVMGYCLIITYFLNIFLQMPASFVGGLDYLCSLLLPALLSLCLPLSSVIFNLLFQSGKYAA